MTRFDATALNRIAQGLAGEDAAEIDYHGMVPRDIDALASAAVAPPQSPTTTSERKVAEEVSAATSATKERRPSA